MDSVPSITRWVVGPRLVSVRISRAFARRGRLFGGFFGTTPLYFNSSPFPMQRPSCPNTLPPWTQLGIDTGLTWSRRVGAMFQIAVGTTESSLAATVLGNDSS